MSIASRLLLLILLLAAPTCASIAGEFKLVGAVMVRKALSGGAAVNQPIPNDATPYPVVTFNEVIYDTTSSAFDPVDSAIVIPAGVTHAEITGQAVWAYNTTGFRQLVILRKNSALNSNPAVFEFPSYAPVANQLAVSRTTTDFSVHTPGLAPVAPGEKFGLFPHQTSGTTLNISGGAGTILSAKFYTYVP